MTVTPSAQFNQPAQSSSSSTAWILRCGNLDAKCLADGPALPWSKQKKTGMTFQINWVVEATFMGIDLMEIYGNMNIMGCTGNYWGIYCDWCVMVTHPMMVFQKSTGYEHRYEHGLMSKAGPIRGIIMYNPTFDHGTYDRFLSSCILRFYKMIHWVGWKLYRKQWCLHLPTLGHKIPETPPSFLVRSQWGRYNLSKHNVYIYNIIHIHIYKYVLIGPCSTPKLGLEYLVTNQFEYSS